MSPIMLRERSPDYAGIARVLDTQKLNATVKMNAAIAKNAARDAARLAEAARRQVRARSDAVSHRAAVSARSGSCFAQPYVPAGIVHRESGGDPTVINGGGHASSPYLSGGRSWGCFQFMPGTWNHSCSDLTYDVPAQIECARRVSRNGTNMQPWAL